LVIKKTVSQTFVNFYSICITAGLKLTAALSDSLFLPFFN